MRKVLKGAALAGCLWGGAALAADDMSNSAQQTQSTSETTRIQTPSGQTEVTAPPGTVVTSPEATSTEVQESNERRTAMEPSTTTGEEKSTTVVVNPAPAAPAPMYAPPEKKKETADMRGVTVLLGGGVEGYTGDFAPALRAGPAWGAAAALKPSKILGIELAYSGATNEVRGAGERGTARGADVIRNGGQAVATVGLTATPVQPYVMGGIGINNYQVRGDGAAFGLQSDTSGSVPLGGGIRGHVGHFTADARFGYNVLFDNQLFGATEGTTIAGTPTSVGVGGRYTGLLSIGSTF